VSDTAEDGIFRRTIRSFVLREGRLTPGQQRAFDELWPRFGLGGNADDGLDWQADQPLDLQAVFGNDHPVTLEIGFGNGDSLAEMAAASPERNFVGIEVHRPGVGHLLLKIEELGLTNLRVMRKDAVQVLKTALPEASLDRVQLFFPDPWHKKRHHKRRILQPAFVALLARVIRPGGHFHAATDWQDYAEHMLAVLSEAGELFENSAGPGNYTPRPAERPLTKFEQRGQRLGHGVWDLLFRRR
jgi:tRNA (guanine-N7-)-methyltransferase